MSKEEIEKLLEEKGIKISIGGCGCCGSPWVTLEIDEKMIVDNEEDFAIDMFNKNQND